MHIDTRKRRPSLGFLFPALFLALFVIFCTEKFTWLHYSKDDNSNSIFYVLIICIVFLVLLLFSFFLFKQKISSTLPVLMLFILSAVFLSSFLYWSAWEQNVDRVENCVKAGSFIFDTTNDASSKEYGDICEAKIFCSGKEISIRVLWPDKSNASVGHRYLGSGTFVKPNLEELGRWNHKNGYAGLVKLSSVQECGYSKSLSGLIAPFRDVSFKRIEAISSKTSGVMAGILLGNKTLYSNTFIEQQFKVTGLAHLMAVSGTHLSIICAFANLLISLTPVNRKIKIVTTLFLLGVYLFLTALSVSALRSCIMCSVALCAHFFKRRRNSIQGLNFCVLLFVLTKPNVVFSAAFQLSALSVFGIIVFTPLIKTWLLYISNGHCKKFFEACAVGIAASFTTTPISIMLFNQIALLSPITTCVVAPFVTALLVIGILGLLVFLLVPSIGSLLLSFASSITLFMQFLVEKFSLIPFSCFPLDINGVIVAFLFLLTICLLWVMWPLPIQNSALEHDCSWIKHKSKHTVKSFFLSKQKFFATATLCIPLLIVFFNGFGVLESFFFSLNAQARIVMLDVGQADSMLIEEGKHAVLIDVGEDINKLKNALARQSIKHLDAIIITHKDKDHAGALSQMAGIISVDNIFVHKDLLNYDGEKEVLEAGKWVMHGKNVQGLSPGNILTFGHFRLIVLGPQDGGESDNEDSLVNLLEYDSVDGEDKTKIRALLTGDAESDAIQKYCNQVKSIDILKVGHHGSKKALSDEEIKELNPCIALISVGADNTYGHPAKETLELLQSVRARIFRTDTNGDITVNILEGKFSVSLQRA